MTRDHTHRRRPGRIRAACRVAVLASAVATLGSASLRAQVTTQPVISTASAPAPVVVNAQVVPPDVQVVRFQGPEGLRVEVLGPNPEPVPVGNGLGLATVGLKVGVSYHLRLSNLPEKPGVEIFPVIEVVGHLHRPAVIDPGKYPIRVVFTEEDLDDVVDRGRLVTQVIYLEDPEQALPIAMPKEQIPVVSISSAEDPLKVATALGRVMAVVRLGGRRPTPEETANGAQGPPGVPGAVGPCPFTQSDAGKCPVVCGPSCGTPPPPGRPWLPKDEYLCDGGDHHEAVQIGGDGGLAGIDPRDAVIRFNDGRKTRALPTNVVCIYAPRFAEVRMSVGPNENLIVTGVARARRAEREAIEAGREGPRRLTRNQGAEFARMRERPSGLAGDVRAGVHSDRQGATGYDQAAHVSVAKLDQSAEAARARLKPMLAKDRAKFLGIKTAESAVITGIIEGASEAVMAWPARETVGVETPPNRPGLAVVKRVSTGEAEAGDVVTYVIEYRNMGNTPIRDVAIVDSLLPRIEYVKGSALGPKGTAFTSDANRVGSTELKWVLPGPVPPGVAGYVSFRAVVR
jgi:uncharacterized repeat protein (TIGR01451 family)